MKRNLITAIILALGFWLPGAAPAGGPKLSQSRAATSSGGGRAGAIQRYWQPSLPPHRPFYSRDFYRNRFDPRHNPRSIIVITPSAYYPYYYAPYSVITSEPFYCHMHHVGFVSRVGFLDHISGTHKVPLETANSICTEDNESCVIEGY